jgi:hypothetical protein
MPRLGPGWRYDEPDFGFGADDRDLPPRSGSARFHGYARDFATPQGRGYARDFGATGYDREYARRPVHRHDAGARHGYDRDMGGFGAGNLYNRIMHGYGRDYPPHDHGSRPAGPSHNWGQGDLSRGGGGYHAGRARYHRDVRPGGYDRDVRPRGGYDGTWFF